MARVIAASDQNVQVRATEREIRAFGASGIDVAVQGNIILLSQSKFIQAFGRIGRVGQTFDISSQRFAEPEPEPTPVPIERPVERKPSVFEETFQQRVERAKREVQVREDRMVSPVSLIPESVRRGERQLPAFEVVRADTGLPIPAGEGVELDFVRRPPPLRKPARQETAEFAPREAVALERQAQQFEVQQIVSELPERLRTGILGGFEQVRQGRPPTGPELFIESAAVGAVTAIPALPATVFSIVSDPIGTGQKLAERAITKPIEFAGETVGGLLVFGGISKGLGRLKAPEPTLSLDIGKSVQFGMGGKPATFTVTKGLIRVGKKEFGAVGRTLTFETGAVSEFIGLGEAAVFKLKAKPKPDIINIAVAGKETFVSGQTRAGFFIGAFKGQKIKDIFAGKFVSKKQADVTQTLTGTLTKKGKPGLGLSFIEDLKITPKPSRLPGGFAPALKPPKQVSASLRKAFLEAPSVKRAVKIEQIKTVVPEAARITGLSMRGFKQTPAARARAELFITPRQIPKQEIDVIPAVKLTQERAVKTATRTRQKLAEELTTKLELKQPTITQQARSFSVMFGQAQTQAQAQRQAQRQRQALRQRSARRQARLSFATPTALRFGFGLPRIPRVDSRFGFGRGEPREFKFREKFNPLGTAEQILGLPRRKKRRRKKK